MLVLLFTARAISYRERQGFAHEDVKLAVVVQKMVNSDVSGIMFTVGPQQRIKEIIVEAGYGLGEAIVGGEVTPDTYKVDRSTMEISRRGCPSRNGNTPGERTAHRESGRSGAGERSEDLRSEDHRSCEIGRQIEITTGSPWT